MARKLYQIAMNIKHCCYEKSMHQQIILLGVHGFVRFCSTRVVRFLSIDQEFKNPWPTNQAAKRNYAAFFVSTGIFKLPLSS